MKKKLIGFLICILLVVTILPASGNLMKEGIIKSLSSGNTLYVGGSGEGNYSKIQDAINGASDGDTVFVYDDSSPYYENVIVNKSITLKGENKKTTVIDGRNIVDVVNIRDRDVTITGFKIINSGTGIEGYNGILVDSVINCNIYDNIIEDNHYGIHVHYSNYCTITGNIINNNYYMGLSLSRSVYPQISDNIITNTSWFGIYFNFIPDSFVCEMNHIERNKYAGIYLVRSNSSVITKNNFIGNKHNAMILDCSNTWTGNYWDRPRILPKLIFGRKGPFDRFPSMIDFDWHPAKEPYDILLMEV